MRYLIFFFLFISILFSCSVRHENNFTSSSDSDSLLILQRDSLIQILVDIHLADAISSTSNFKDIEKRDFSYSCYQSVFDKYKISKERFDKSMKIYSRDPKNLDLIYEDVLVKMSELEGKSMVKDVFNDASSK